MGILYPPRFLTVAVTTIAAVLLMTSCGRSNSSTANATTSGATTAHSAASSTASPNALASSSGSSTPAVAGHAIPVGSSSQTISVGGTKRSFILYRPANLPAAAPLVVMMHGGFGTAANAEKDYGWDAQADSGGFIVAYPDGLNNAWNTGGGCCGQSGRKNVDDVGFITQMVAEIERDVPIDQSRVYATGISNGGIMAYTLACKTTIFAAIGPDSATQLGDCTSPNPISVIHIHGDADKTILYNGGESATVAHINGPAIPALNAAWRGIDNCPAPSITVAPPVTTSIANCPEGRTVELITIAGAGHQWPGATKDKAAQKRLGTDPPSTALDATKAIWQFFSQHSKP